MPRRANSIASSRRSWPRCLVAVVLLALAVAAQPALAAEPETPAEHRRTADQTYLTFPEWFLVFSPAEYADFVASRAPSKFPFNAHVGELWQGYGHAITATKDMPFNAGYRVMILVIGISTTVEYALRSAYETLLGRLTEVGDGPPATAEDAYGARLAQDYVDFIRVRPWYEFDYVGALRGLWRDVPWKGAHPLRKMERRYALTTEYGIKAAYAKLIGLGTQATYEAAAPTTAVVVRNVPIDTKDVARVREMAPDRALVLLPRYQPFTDVSRRLAAAGASFDEIAGNGVDARILVTVLAPQAWSPPPSALVLFQQPVSTRPGIARHALTTRVGDLSATLRSLDAAGVTVEHVFDY